MKPVCDSHDYCPLQRKVRSKVCHTCAWYTRMIGTHPQTGDQMDKWECSIVMMPLLMIEQARIASNVNCAINDLRNENKEYADNMQNVNMLRLRTLLSVVKK